MPAHQFRKSPTSTTTLSRSTTPYVALPAEHVRALSGLSVAGPTSWNSLPDRLRDPTLSSDSFRKLRDYLRVIKLTKRSGDATWFCAVWIHDWHWQWLWHIAVDHVALSVVIMKIGLFISDNFVSCTEGYPLSGHTAPPLLTAQLFTWARQDILFRKGKGTERHFWRCVMFASTVMHVTIVKLMRVHLVSELFEQLDSFI